QGNRHHRQEREDRRREADVLGLGRGAHRAAEADRPLALGVPGPASRQASGRAAGLIMAMLEVQGLSKSFRGLRAVGNVSFNVPEKGIVALIGPNGAGKTTCFNLIAGAM